MVRGVIRVAYHAASIYSTSFSSCEGLTLLYSSFSAESRPNPLSSATTPVLECGIDDLDNPSIVVWDEKRRAAAGTGGQKSAEV
jgi:hypothetical protein